MEQNILIGIAGFLQIIELINGAIIALTVPSEGYVGQSTSLLCTQVGFIKADGYSWLKDSTSIYDQDGVVGTFPNSKYIGSDDVNGFYLTINNLAVSDEADYECNAGFTTTTKQPLKIISKAKVHNAEITSGKLIITFTEIYPNTTTVTSVTCDSTNIPGSLGTTSSAGLGLFDATWESTSVFPDSVDQAAECTATLQGYTISYDVIFSIEGTATTSTTTTTTTTTTSTTTTPTSTTTTPTTTTTTPTTTTTTPTTTTTTPTTTTTTPTTMTTTPTTTTTTTPTTTTTTPTTTTTTTTHITTTTTAATTTTVVIIVCAVIFILVLVVASLILWWLLKERKSHSGNHRHNEKRRPTPHKTQSHFYPGVQQPLHNNVSRMNGSQYGHGQEGKLKLNPVYNRTTNAPAYHGHHHYYQGRAGRMEQYPPTMAADRYPATVYVGAQPRVTDSNGLYSVPTVHPGYTRAHYRSNEWPINGSTLVRNRENYVVGDYSRNWY